MLKAPLISISLSSVKTVNGNEHSLASPFMMSTPFTRQESFTFVEEISVDLN